MGMALLLAALFFNTGIADSSDLQIEATSTPDRLAEPTLPASPSQADVGARVYWLSCLPCHGDKGQGLTDEFRTTYPPEEQYCWERGCHGERPYENGFTIPKIIPGLIGPGTLYKFTDAAQLNSYIRATMPFWKPGSLTAEEAWQVTAFILRENGIWNDAAELNETNAGNVRISRQPLTPLPTPQQAEVQNGGGGGAWIFLLSAGLLLFILLLVFKRSRSAREDT
jgi:cytochrome c